MSGFRPARSDQGDRSVVRRLARSFGLLIGLVAFTGVAALTGALLQHSALDDLTHRVVPTQEANLRLRGELADSSRRMDAYLLTGDPAQLAAFLGSRNDFQGPLAEAFTHAPAGARPYLSAQERPIQDYLRITDQVQTAVPGSPGAAALAAAAQVPYDAFEATNAEMDGRLTHEADELSARADLILWSTGAATCALLVLATVLTLIAVLHTVRAITRPLAGIRTVLGRLAQGDHGARAPDHGPAEIRAVAHAVNMLADENDRLRRLDAERDRLAAAARQAGIGIRSGLDLDQILDEAVRGLGEALRADHVLVLLAGDDGGADVPVVRAWNTDRGILPSEEVLRLPPAPAEIIREHYAQDTSWSVDDIRPYLASGAALPGAPGSFGTVGPPPEVRAALTATGVVALLVSPFGSGTEAMGAVILCRCRPGDVWLPMEVEAVESIGAGLGRAVRQSRTYRQETELVDRLKALDKAKNDFLSTVSHELRTPLTSIVGYVELLANDSGPLSDGQRHMVEVVDRNSARLRNLIEDLLTISRIESGAFTSERLPVDLRQLVNSSVEAIRPAAMAVPVTLSQLPAEDDLVVLGDVHQLDRVLMNLLTNAVKFTPPGGLVTVSTSRGDGEAVLTVGDTGIGIPEKDQKDLFHRFFRASNATELAIPGTGLGLAIVRSIVTNHEGRLEIHSAEGEGTTVIAHLPLLPDTPG
ncbi:ATP-binding protein [Kitasatospora sp. NPDC085895]|uniref:ATP-binding protein n=1 Tax=Kitasatospora sp. NPDC085895 TaxID=3155057 RepID=UPI00344BC726